MNYLRLISDGVANTSNRAFVRQDNQTPNREQDDKRNVPSFLLKEISDTNGELTLPTTGEVEASQSRQLGIDWLVGFEQSSHLLMAAIELPNFTLRYANECFCRLMGIERQNLGNREINLLALLAELNDVDREYLYKRLLLQLVLRDIYQINIQGLFEEPIVASTANCVESETHWVEFWLRLPPQNAIANSQENQKNCPIQLKVSRVDRNLDEFADLPISQMSETELQNWLKEPSQIQLLLSKLVTDNYHIEGLVLLEGLDVTLRETMRRLTHLLLEQNSILRPKKFRQVNQLLRSLFQAQYSLILSAEREQGRLFFCPESKQLKSINYSMQSLQGSHFLKAAEENQVYNIPDLSRDCPTECERSLLKRGVRSLLLIPLVVKATALKSEFRQLAGVIGLTSDRPYNFSSLQYRYATELILPFTVALRQAIQQRFTQFNNIHPAVEWKFLQEAERRSWGMPPEPINFTNVYPLYGISDIRGSSQERNRAIQADLLEQYQLALAAVEAFCQSQPTSLGEQLRLDLIEQIKQLESGITVDAELTAIRYLRSAVEIYFDYFSQTCSNARLAVEAYREACQNEHECVYKARDLYDRTIGQINSLLRETWDRWQVSMQKITTHYCDIESTDGIDHMIYAGASIDPNFCSFHLCNLRYEQLRAICDCGRTAFQIQSKYNTQMEVTHLVLVQDSTVDIFHNEETEKLFEVRGTRDTRYELVKKRIDKAIDAQSKERITQPGMLTIVYSTDDEWMEYQQYLRYLVREGWVAQEIEWGTVEPLQGVTGLKFARVRILPDLNRQE
ncbi:MAG TPA: GAF domain-containing protein [Leptolyngbyaceae cyanobacterium]